MMKHCVDYGTLLIEKELEKEGMIPFCPTCAEEFLLYYIDNIGDR